MQDYKHLADRDRRKAYKNPAHDGGYLATAVVFSALGFVSAWFWLGVAG